jgi:hypothetical protein
MKRCRWCNNKGATKSQRSSFYYCSDPCRVEASKAGSAFFGVGVIPPAEKERRTKLCNQARDGSKKAQKILSEQPYALFGIFNPKTKSMVRW